MTVPSHLGLVLQLCGTSVFLLHIVYNYHIMVVVSIFHFLRSHGTIIQKRLFQGLS